MKIKPVKVMLQGNDIEASLMAGDVVRVTAKDLFGREHTVYLTKEAIEAIGKLVGMAK